MNAFKLGLVSFGLIVTHAFASDGAIKNEVKPQVEVLQRDSNSIQLAQSPNEYRICTNSFGKGKNCVIRATNQTCPTNYMMVGAIHNSRKNACDAARSNDNCTDSISGCQ